MSIHGRSIKLFTGNSNQELAGEIAERIGLPLSRAEVGKFSDGETAISIKEPVRGADVFIIQSTSSPVNDNLVELLIMIDALRRASAQRITAVIPYFGYARQDRKARPRDPISAKLVANLLTEAGADRILTMDLHAPQIQGFFDIPVDHLLGYPTIVQYLKKRLEGKLEEAVIVSPDIGSVSRARRVAESINCPLAIIDKRRPQANVSEVMNIIGDIQGKVCILIDDLIDTAGTIVNGATALAEFGASEIYACCTHGVLSGPAVERIENSSIQELLVLNTIVLPEEKRISKIHSLSVAPIFAEAIERVYRDVSMSSMF